VLKVIHDFIMADLGGKMHLCEVLLQTSENYIRNAQNAQSNFGDNGINRTQTSDSFSLFKHGENWAEDCCGLRSKPRSMLIIFF
jgi:hypothetical protein